jgi:hypothetical protein
VTRLLGEVCIVGKMRGFGRVGLDFWKVLRDKRGRLVGHIQARYPESQWANLDKESVNFVPPGPDGALLTTRLLLMREGLQECEARIVIERALTDEALRAKLPADLVASCERLITERSRLTVAALENHAGCGFTPRSTTWGGWQRWFNQQAMMTGWYAWIVSGWQERSRQLYDAAALVQEAIAEVP